MSRRRWGRVVLAGGAVRGNRRNRWSVRRLSGSRQTGSWTSRSGCGDCHPGRPGCHWAWTAAGFQILKFSGRITHIRIASVLMSTSQQYDAIIIGSGQAGTPLSTALAAAGMHTALIERKHVGGTCINEGCTPTKTMVASGRVAYLARRAADYGVHTGASDISVDLRKVRQRKRDIVDKFRNGSQARIEKTANLELIFGDAKFAGSSTGPRTIEVRSNDGAQRSLSAKYIFIDAGTRASRPELDGLDDVPALDNVSIMELDAVPEHLLILGGGYIGLEFGQLFRRFGSRVTIVQLRGQLLT